MRASKAFSFLLFRSCKNKDMFRFACLWRNSTVRRSFAVDYRAESRHLTELGRVLQLHKQMPSEALRLRVVELFSLARMSENAPSHLFDAVSYTEALLALNIPLSDPRSRIALHHIESHLALGAGVNFVIANVALFCQSAKSAEVRSAFSSLLIRHASTMSRFELVRLCLGFQKRNVREKTLWGYIIDQLLEVHSELSPISMARVVYAMGACGFYHRDFVDACEKVATSGQVAFDMRSLKMFITAYKSFGRPALCFQLMVSGRQAKHTPMDSLANFEKPAEHALVKPDRKTFAEQEMEAQSHLTLSQKEELDNKVQRVLPRLALSEIPTVLASTRQKESETAAQVRIACTAIQDQLRGMSLRASSTPGDILPPSLLEDLTVVLIKTPFMSVPDVAYAVEDTLLELFGRSCESFIVDPIADPRGALRQISILTEAVVLLPRLVATPLIRTLLAHVTSLGSQYEDAAKGSSPAVQRESLPAYAYHTVRLLIACDSIAVLDANRQGIALGLHGLPASKAAGLALVVAGIKNPPAAPGSARLSHYLFDALIDVFAVRGTSQLSPPLAANVIEALHILKVSKTDLMLQLITIIVTNARGLLNAVSKTNFDATQSIIAIRRSVSMLSAERYSTIFSTTKLAASDTVGIVLRLPDTGVVALIESLHVMALVTTCGAATRHDYYRRVARRKAVAAGFDREALLSVATQSTDAQLAPSANTNDVRLIEELARRLRATLSAATAADTVSLLRSLSLMRDVPQLQHPLLLKELPLLAVRHATEILGSASPAIVSGLSTSTGLMDIPMDILDPFRIVCGKALLDALEKESVGTGGKSLDFDRAVTYAKAAHALATFGGLDVVPHRLGAVLWGVVRGIFMKGAMITPLDGAALLLIVGHAHCEGSVVLTPDELANLSSYALTAGGSWDCSVLSLVSLAVAMIKLGSPCGNTHPLHSVVVKRRLDILSSKEAMLLLSRQSLEDWVGTGTDDLTERELGSLSQAIAKGIADGAGDAHKGGVTRALKGVGADIREVYQAYTDAVDGLSNVIVPSDTPRVVLVNRRVDDPSDRDTDLSSDDVASSPKARPPKRSVSPKAPASKVGRGEGKRAKRKK